MSGLSVLKRAECRSAKIAGLDDLPHQQTTTMSRELVLWFGGNRRLIVREVADEVGINIESCHQNFLLKTSDASR